MPKPPASAPEISPSAWNEARTLRPLVKRTVTHSPAATWSTSGSGRMVPFLTAVAIDVGTKAARILLLYASDLRSTAVTLKVRVGDSAGHGLAAPPETGG